MMSNNLWGTFEPERVLIGTGELRDLAELHGPDSGYAEVWARIVKSQRRKGFVPDGSGNFVRAVRVRRRVPARSPAA
ncbi:hypothetical protein [Rhodococcus sp. NPDC057529]|uniref:hypothetical protein n=1 Tax=Rhodococcus sp. NPDC057529 TaxID=3346158 RepID=UPI00366C8435